MHTNPEVLALLALGEQAATPAEQEHIRTCPACSEEVAELARIADVGRSSTMSDTISRPSPQVWERIQAELGFDSPGAVLTRTATAEREANAIGASSDSPAGSATVTDISGRRDADGPRRTSAGRRFLALAVAAALALIVGIGVGISYEQRIVKPEVRVIASAKLAPLPEYAGASGTVEVTADGRGGRQLIVKMSSPKPITGTPEVWLMNSKGKITNMGKVVNGTAIIPVPAGMSLFEVPIVDISDEPAHDTNPTGHDGKSMLRGELV
jgi:anti-sigma factor RsiW